MPRPTHRRSATLPVLLAVIVLSAAYTFWHLRRGLLPHDDGAIGQAAERVLRGELPHRDFDDVYTGGLAWLNAWGFQLLGTSLWTMRLVLFAAFVAWVPAVFYVASRFARPVAAGAVTLLAVVWSVPNYPAPMPSWYNLFLATFGIAMLLRHLERPRTGWLVAAGVVGGLSILMKVVGLYYVAGVLLFLVFESHELSSADQGVTRAARAYQVFVTTALAAFVATLLLLVRRQLAPPELVHFVLPGALIATFLAYREWTHPAGRSSHRFASLARVGVPFVIGVALPIALFVLPYLATGATGTLLNGVFVLPAKRFSAAARSMPPLATMAALFPFAAAFAVVRRWPGSVRPVVVPLLAVVLTLVVVIGGLNNHVYRFAWNALFNLVPLVTVTALLVLSHDPDTDGQSRLARSRIVLLVSVTALCSVVQFPFAAPIYLCYVLPLAILTAAALYSRFSSIPHAMGGVVLGFFLIFAVVRVNPTSLQAMGVQYMAYQATRPLDLERGGVDVFGYQKRGYTDIDRLLREHARGGYTWASPDSPEIYFLTGLRNPTRSLFDFFDEPANRTVRILSALDRHGVTAVVLNRNPEFSLPISNDMYDALVVRYPSSADVGHFQVRWR